MFTIPQTQIFYSNNATTMSADTAGAISWVRNLIFLKCFIFTPVHTDGAFNYAPDQP